MKIIYQGKPYKVYGMHTNYNSTGWDHEIYAYFLIFTKKYWQWISTDDCIPYKKKKHKKRGSKNKKEKICL